MPVFLRDFHSLKSQADDEFPFGRFYPCFQDRKAESGTVGGHYFHQDLLVARRIFQNNPARHVDIGSRFDGFIAHVASFRPIEVFDIRGLKNPPENVLFKKADLMDANFSLVDYCDSLSCLHALEHFGLGRYGDRIDYHGHLIGWENIHKLLCRGGRLYFSVPIGKQRIEFNAHRVFSLSYLLKLMEKKYSLEAFSYVSDGGDLVKDPSMSAQAIADNFGCRYGCGIFELVKL